MTTSEQTQIMIAIAQLDTKVEMALLDLGKDVGDHEARIRHMERRLYAIPGAATIIASGALLWSIFGS